MNGYSELLRYFYSIGKPLVNTMSKGNFDKIDLDRKTIFPLLHVNISGGGFPSGGVILFNVQLACYDIRDINKAIDDDKYWGNDNEDDNINSTLAILNRVWQLMLKDFAENNITSSTNPSFEVGTLTNKNLLDGAVLSFDVEVPNVEINLCQ